MDPRLLRYYNKELQFIREMGGEFAKEFPKIAARLGLEGIECADPYVERLLEGFAFLTARVQLKLDAEFPRFTQHLLESVYPHYLAPTPSMAVVQFQADPSEGTLTGGFVVPRGSALRTPLSKGDQTPCEYRTAHDVALWPIQIVEAAYVTGGPGTLGAPEMPGVRAGLRIRLKTTPGVTFEKLPLDRLVFYLGGGGELPVQWYERMTANGVGVLLQPATRAPGWRELVPKSAIRPIGFEDAEALLPYGPRSFQGYRLLQEYFAFPERYRFVELGGLRGAVQRCREGVLELTVLLNRSDPFLESAVDATRLSLFCAPAINLFPRHADRIHLLEREHEYQLLPDRTRPLDFEVYQVTEAVGHGTSADRKQEFRPLYGARDVTRSGDHRAYYTVRREPRVLSAKERRQGPRSSYVGSEVFVALVDADEAPFDSDLRQLAVSTLCTNRDLPLRVTTGQGRTDFTLQASAPVSAVRCVAGPTKPRPPHAEGEAAWRLISHLSLNYLSLTDTDEKEGASALRELLSLYGSGDASARKQIEGVRSVGCAPIYRRIPRPGPVTFGRGLEVALTLDESAFGGSGPFLLAAVLERFFARYVSINSFTETVLHTQERGEVFRWPTRLGQRLTT
ncbi:MAG: type VI secretion system baseplate subunit TssF [Proteobacteria bacterium]|nr:type VI secretion system baseplate subunit TssF [Pseudomonadota bacterium]